MNKSLRTCHNGHKYHKSSDCPVCPACENESKPKDGFLASLAAPARRALENEGIISLELLSTYSERELLNLHGFGKSSIPKLREVLDLAGLSFRQEKAKA